MSTPALAAAADQSRAIVSVWQSLLWPNVVIYIAMLAALGWALWRRRSAGMDAATLQRQERNWVRALVGWTVFIAATLTVYTSVSFLQDRHLLAREHDALSIRITANQWWWQVDYLDPDPSRRVSGANELHLPVGRMTRIELRSGDVIHSLWIPALDGKEDLIPGRYTELAITPRAPGHYLGECAEFCGLQHAHMLLPVTVESQAAFATWLEAQRRPAATPTSPAAVRGKQLFESGPCAMCHAIAGTVAASNVGPDLTHVASRPTLAAGALPNDRAHLAAWLVDPQAYKPGTRMPDPRLQPQEVTDLVDYLEGLR